MTDEDRDEARASTHRAVPDWRPLIGSSRRDYRWSDSRLVRSQTVEFVEAAHGTSFAVPFVDFLAAAGAAAKHADPSVWDRHRQSAYPFFVYFSQTIKAWFDNELEFATSVPPVIVTATAVHVRTQLRSLEGPPRLQVGFSVQTEPSVSLWRSCAITFDAGQAAYALLRMTLDVSPNEHRWWCQKASPARSASGEGCTCDAKRMIGWEATDLPPLAAAFATGGSGA